MSNSGVLVGQAVGFVLAGGESSRMGSDKSLAEFDGEPLIVRALNTLRGAGLGPVIAGARSPLSQYAPVLPDEVQGRGPLSGVVAGLQSNCGKLLVFLTVDLPLMPSGLIAYMIRHALLTGRTVTVASVNGYPQTFPAVLRSEALPACEAELQSGQGGCFAAYRRAVRDRGEEISILPVESLVQSGEVVHPDDLPPVFWFLNVNSPRDLAHARDVSRQRTTRPRPNAMMEPDGRSQL